MRPRISLGSYLLSSVLGGCLKAAKESRGLKAGLTDDPAREEIPRNRTTGRLQITAGPLQSRRCHEQPVPPSEEGEE